MILAAIFSPSIAFAQLACPKTPTGSHLAGGIDIACAIARDQAVLSTSGVLTLQDKAGVQWMTQLTQVSAPGNASVASPNNSTLMTTTGNLSDGMGHVVTLTASGQVAVNGVADTSTSGATLLLWYNGGFYQQKPAGWLTYPLGGGPGTVTAAMDGQHFGMDPRPVPSGTVLGGAITTAADGTVVATMGTSSFAWGNQAGASVVGGGSSTLNIIQSPHSGANQAALLTRMATGAACYTALSYGTDPDSFYNYGLLLHSSTTNKNTILEHIFFNTSGSNIWAQTENDYAQTGDVAITAIPGTSYPAGYAINQPSFDRLCQDGSGNFTALISPTGSDGQWQQIATFTASGTGSPDHIGPYEDAQPNNGVTNPYSGYSHLVAWQVTTGNTPQAAAAGGDANADFATFPAAGAGFPVSDNPPTIAGDTPYGLTLAAGAVELAAYTFPGSGESQITMPDEETFRQNVYFNLTLNNYNALTGNPQDASQPAKFWAVGRTYPLGNPHSLIKVTPTGLKVMSHCAGTNYQTCGPQHVRSGGFVLPIPYRPNMTYQFKYVPPIGQHSWFPLWAFPGERHTPFPANTMTASYLGNGQGFEIDFNDHFKRYPNDLGGGCVYGGEVDIGTPNIYGTTWQTAPHAVYAASSTKANGTASGWSAHYNTPPGQPESTSDAFECHDAYVQQTAQYFTIVWRGDGSNYIDAYMNGQRFYTMYMEYPQSASFGGHQVGMQLIVGFQGVGTDESDIKSGNAVVTDNDGVADGWTATFQSIKIWSGTVVNPTGNDVATNACPNTGSGATAGCSY